MLEDSRRYDSDIEALLSDSKPSAPVKTSPAERAQLIMRRALNAGDKDAGWAEIAKDEELSAWAVARGHRRKIERAASKLRYLAPYEDADDQDDEDLKAMVGVALHEDGVALAFAQRYADRLRYCHSARQWFEWSGAHWKCEEKNLAFEFARRVCRAQAKVSALSTAAKAMHKAVTAAAVERFARSDSAFAVTAADWDRDLWLLGTPGGTVELRTGEIRAAQPEDMITRLTAATPVPLDEFYAATDCPRWLAFLDEATGNDADAIRFLQQWAGYSLTGDTSEHALLFVHGPGGSGKSTAINTLGDVLGDYAINVEAETLTVSRHGPHCTEIARLDGARFARTSETESGRAWAESRIKSWTGGDTVTARQLYAKPFEFKPQLKLTVVGNHAPKLSNVDEAMRRRFNVLPFVHPPAKADPSLQDALRAEWPGILSWAIVGCLDWQKNRLVRPQIVTVATDSYFAEQDTFAQWIDDRCEVGKSFAEAGARLWESWSSYARAACADAGVKNSDFPARLAKRGFSAIKDTCGVRGRGFRGIRLAASRHTESFDDLT